MKRNAKQDFVVVTQISDDTTTGRRVERIVQASDIDTALASAAKVCSNGREPVLTSLNVTYLTIGTGLTMTLGFGDLHDGMCGTYADEMITICVRAA